MSRPRKYTDNQLIALHAQGLIDRKIGAKLGVCADTVQAGRIRLKLASNFDPSAPRGTKTAPASQHKPATAQELHWWRINLIDAARQRAYGPRP